MVMVMHMVIVMNMCVNGDRVMVMRMSMGMCMIYTRL